MNEEIMMNDSKHCQNADVSIPVIDISHVVKGHLTSEFRETVTSIAKACRDDGFFYIKNHGVDEQLQEDVLLVLKSFFALPKDQKNKIKSKGRGDFRGYFELLSESTGYLKEDKRKPDWREGIYTSIEIPDDHLSKELYPSVTQRNQWPEEPADFKDTIEKYCAALTELGFQIMSTIALGLGLKRDFFEATFKPYPTTILGMYHYPPPVNTDDPDECSLGEHTDYGVLTILKQDDVGGLEIQTETGQWIPAPPIPGTFVVNLGDMLEVWTNGAYKATSHRVKKIRSGKDRISVAFFFEPSLESVIKPIKFGAPVIPLMARKTNSYIPIPVNYGKYLESKYDHTFSVTNK